MAETDLAVLLAEMAPVANAGTWVFTRVVGDPPTNVPAIVTVREPEGTTLVVATEDAHRHGLAHEHPMTWITLQVCSSLVAVGLTAAVSTALASAGISANVVAGFTHDHLFVPVERAGVAMDVLVALAARG